MSAAFSKRYLDELAISGRAKLERRLEIAEQMHIKQKEIYARYNPSINKLKADKKVEIDALQEWRRGLYESENL
jgi:hypothetical protein